MSDDSGQAKALVDLMKHYEWTHVLCLYTKGNTRALKHFGFILRYEVFWLNSGGSVGFAGFYRAVASPCRKNKREKTGKTS